MLVQHSCRQQRGRFDASHVLPLQGFDPITYGVGSSLFFVTFCIFQVRCCCCLHLESCVWRVPSFSSART